MKKSLALFLVALIGFGLLYTLMASNARCFNQLVIDLETCREHFSSDSRERQICEDGAWETFKDCLGKRIADKSDILFEAKLPTLILARATGKPFRGETTFAIDEPGYYYINVYNGKEGDNSSRVTSANITITPYSDIFTPSDFNKQTPFLVKKVYLEEGVHTFSGSVRGKPESFMVIVVADRDLTGVAL